MAGRYGLEVCLGRVRRAVIRGGGKRPARMDPAILTTLLSEQRPARHTTALAVVASLLGVNGPTGRYYLKRICTIRNGLFNIRVVVMRTP